jgi:hypothetical protein
MLQDVLAEHFTRMERPDASHQLVSKHNFFDGPQRAVSVVIFQI